MNKYVFVLGNNYKLSIIEILNYFYNNNINFYNSIFTKEILILDLEKDINCQNVIDIFGGTIKIGKLILQENNINEKIFEKIILDNSDKNKRINFGFNNYILKDKFNFKIKNLGLTIKNYLKYLGYGSRLVMDKNINILSSVTTEKNNLIKENGFEFLITKLNNTFLIFKIEAIQNFENYSKRDFGRPNRDSKSGMLPPKLCKMMINLSSFIDKENITVLDPFCGSGTMIAELLLLNYKNIIGSDISEKAINDSKINTDWIKENYNIKNKNINIFKEDIKNINNKIEKNSIDLIITEPYLGPSNLNINNILEIKKNIIYLENLYLETFKKLYEVLKRGGEIIIIFPVFKISLDNKISFLKLNILDEIKKMNFIKEDFKKLNIENFSEILYSREDQRVLREVHKFIKK